MNININNNTFRAVLAVTFSITLIVCAYFGFEAFKADLNRVKCSTQVLEVVPQLPQNRTFENQGG